jgi:hypothetical protein
MKRSIQMFAIIAVLSIGLVSLGVAQMMNKKQGQSPMTGKDPMSQSGTMGMGMMGMMNRLDNMMGNMSRNCTMVNNDFEKLQKHFQSMMQMTDMNSLKAEMEKHQQMMQNMQQNMMQQEKLCRNMASLMGSQNMQGSQEMGNNTSGSSK